MSEPVSPGTDSQNQDEAATELSKEVMCAICQSVLIDPRVLSCQHAFCLRCLFDIVKRERGNNASLQCPFRCHDVTAVPDDIRTLKRNTMLANVCLKLRRIGFKNRRHANCDWCVGGEQNTSVRKHNTFCDRCGSVICELCDASPQCDHSYLCIELGQKHPPSMIVLPRMVSELVAQEIVMTALASFEMSSEAEERLTRWLYSTDGVIQEPPKPGYVPGLRYDVHVEGGGHFAGLSVVVLADDFSPLGVESLEGALISHSAISALDVSTPGPALQLECIHFGVALEEFGNGVAKLMSALARLSPHHNHGDADCMSPYAAKHIAVITLVTDAAITYIRLHYIPLLRQTNLLAQIIELDHVESMLRRIDTAGDTFASMAISSQLGQELHEGNVNSAVVFSQFERACEALQRAQNTVADLAVRCLQTPCESVVAEDYESRGIEYTAERILAMLDKPMQCAKVFATLSSDAFDKALQSSLVDEHHRYHFAAYRDRLRDLRQSESLVCFSWAAAVGLQSLLNNPLPHDTRPLSFLKRANDDEQEVAAVQRLIDSLLPQIAQFRQQHADLVADSYSSRSADGSGVRTLQAQLTQLMFQAIDLFTKDEVMKAQPFFESLHRIKHIEQLITSAVQSTSNGELIADAITCFDAGHLCEVYEAIRSSQMVVDSAAKKRLAASVKAFISGFVSLMTIRDSTERNTAPPCVLDATKMPIADGSTRAGILQAAVVRSSSLGESRDLPIVGIMPEESERTKSRVEAIAIGFFNQILDKSSSTYRVTFAQAHGGPSAYVLAPVLMGKVKLRCACPASSYDPRDHEFLSDDGIASVDYIASGTRSSCLAHRPLPRTKLVKSIVEINRRLRSPVFFAFVAATVVVASLVTRYFRLG